MTHTKKKRKKMFHSWGCGWGKKVMETVSDEAQALDLLDNDFKSTTSDIFKESKETKGKELSFENYIPSVGRYH